MEQDHLGRVGSAETGSRASTEPASSLGPTGFDPARKQAVKKALFRSYAIKAASDRATKAELAASWFGDYGRNCVGKDAATIDFRLYYAASCVGSNEAKAYITDAIYAMLPQIVATAQEMADREMQRLLDLVPLRDSDGSPEGRDRNGLDGEAATARAEGIAKDQPHG